MKPGLKLLLALAAGGILFSCGGTASRDRKVEKLLAAMTQEEKLAYVGGHNDFYIRAVERLGIPEIRMADGPQGVRNAGKATAMPCGIMLSATWNKDLAYEYGKALGRESRARGIHILLGPGVNIYRSPLCGRNFEYFGEDPHLTAQTSVGYIRGVQDQSVVATIKHFTANNSEYDRHKTSSDVDERTLYEIYFPAFEAAVKEAGVGAVMSSYNPLNEVYTSQHEWLLTDVLREQWGFDGVMMSDWRATYDCVGAANAGLDLEMPVAKHMTPDSLSYFLSTGAITHEVIDEKVRRILRMIVDFDFMERAQLDESIPLNDSQNARTALEVAREGIVMLKNENRTLPLHADDVKKIGVMGYNSAHFVTGGGSGWIDPFQFVGVADGVKTLAAERGMEVIEVPESSFSVPVSQLYTDRGLKAQGLVATFFDNKNLEGKPLHTRVDPFIHFNWLLGTGVEGLSVNDYSVRWTGVIVPEESGTYEFFIGGDDGYRLFVNGDLLCDHWRNGVSSEYAKVRLQKDRPYDIRVEYYQGRGDARIRLEWRLIEHAIIAERLRDADVIVACFGFTETTETEGRDRTFAMPAAEAEFMDAVFALGKPVVAVVNAGGNMYMQEWIDKVDALLWAWYPGQEGGTAVAEILFGETNPSGKLPVTFEKRWEDNPVFGSYHDPDGDKRVEYTEGIFVGYRGYDRNGTDVQYPFGYGLSYTEFSLSDLKVSSVCGGRFKVDCILTNTGPVAGAEVVQLYVGFPRSSVETAPKSLKRYEKVYLESGQSRQLSFVLEPRDFTYYDMASKGFAPVQGPCEVMIGNSSRHIALRTTIE